MNKDSATTRTSSGDGEGVVTSAVCHCGKPLKWHSKYIMRTCVGYGSPEGHDHDDNCVSRTYQCEDGHKIGLSIRRRCPNPECDWKGKEKCFCHEGPKLDDWPEGTEELEGLW